MAALPGAAMFVMLVFVFVIVIVVMVVMRMLVAVRVPFGAGHRFRGCQNQPPGLDSLGADQVIGQFPDLAGATAEQDHLEAPMLIQVNMSRGDNPVKPPVLNLGEPFGDPAGVVIVDQRDHTHCLAVFLADHLFDERGTHQAPDGFTPVGIVVLFAVRVKSLQQLATNRDTESDERIFH